MCFWMVPALIMAALTYLIITARFSDAMSEAAKAREDGVEEAVTTLFNSVQ